MTLPAASGVLNSTANKVLKNANRRAYQAENTLAGLKKLGVCVKL
jgi:hypothetical protein